MLPSGNFHTLTTPCYIIDDERLSTGINEIRKALSHHFANFRIGYSVKTNSLPWMIRRALELGCVAEVVSEDEYRLARSCGALPDSIIYNGVMKSRSTMEECLEAGGIVNLDSWQEIEWIIDNPPADRRVGLRVKSDYPEVAPDECTGHNDDSRFGFSVASGDFGKAVRLLRESGVEIEGLHIHRTTSSRSVDYYRNAARYAVRVAREYSLLLRYLDIGGGFFGIFPGKPTFEEYVKAIREVLCEEGFENIMLIVEPGSAVSAWCMKLLSSVTDVRSGRDGVRYITLDVSRNDVDPFFRKKGYMIDIYRQCDDEPRQIIPMQILGGYTCLEDDRFFEMKESFSLERGDLICFNRVGAYTVTLSGQFIRFLPAVYVVTPEGYRCVRRKWTAADLLVTEIE